MKKNARKISLPETIIIGHVHDRGMRQRYKTTTLEVVRQAMAALISVVIIMPNTDPAIIDDMILAMKIKILNRARKILDIRQLQRIWFGATNSNYWECKKAVKNEYVVGIKIYPQKKSGQMVTTGKAGTGVSNFEAILRLMKMVAEHNRRTGTKKAISFHPSHPLLGHGKDAEIHYVSAVIRMARFVPEKLKPFLRIIFCHITCKESAEIILRAQEDGLLAAMEICVDYLWFDSDGTNWNPDLDPCFYHRYNNLRGSADREYLIRLLLTDNPLVFVSSDHAPHTKEEKLKGSGGTPSIMEVVPVMITLAINHGISEYRLAQLLSWNISWFLAIPASSNLIDYEIEERVHDLSYGDHIINHWNGKKMWFAVKEIEQHEGKKQDEKILQRKSC